MLAYQRPGVAASHAKVGWSRLTRTGDHGGSSACPSRAHPPCSATPPARCRPPCEPIPAIPPARRSAPAAATAPDPDRRPAPAEGLGPHAHARIAAPFRPGTSPSPRTGASWTHAIGRCLAPRDGDAKPLGDSSARPAHAQAEEQPALGRQVRRWPASSASRTRSCSGSAAAGYGADLGSARCRAQRRPAAAAISDGMSPSVHEVRVVATSTRNPAAPASMPKVRCALAVEVDVTALRRRVATGRCGP